MVIDRSSKLQGLMCWAVCLTLVGSSGCQRSAPDSAEETAANRTGAAREALERKRLCLDNFDKIYQLLKPEPVNVNAELQSVQDILNQWLNSCAEWTDEPIDPQLPVFAELSDRRELASLGVKAASQLDVLYLRDQLLTRRIFEQITAGIPTDASRLRAIFAFVTRNLTPDEKLINPVLQVPDLIDEATLDSLKARSIPRSLQDIALSGRGTAEDRCWLLASLVQQLGFQSLLIVPPGHQEQPLQLPALVVIPAEQELFVFCPAWGVELRNNGKNWTSADLQQGWGVLFDELANSGEEAAALVKVAREADWKQASLMIPASPLLVSPRMRALQKEFAGNYVCEVFQPLAQPEDSRRAVLQVFTDFQQLLLPDSEPRFWDYPHGMYQRVVKADGPTQQLRELYLKVLFKEVISLRSSEDQNEQRSFTQSDEKRLLMARIDQITGDRGDAIATFMKLRLQPGVLGRSPEVIMENRLRALQAEDAHYWSALSQYENGDYKSAASTLRNYLNRYTAGRWIQASQILLAQTLLEQNQTEAARILLQQSAWSPPERLRQLSLLQSTTPADAVTPPTITPPAEAAPPTTPPVSSVPETESTPAPATPAESVAPATPPADSATPESSPATPATPTPPPAEETTGNSGT